MGTKNKCCTAVFWRIRPKLAFRKSVKTPKKKVLGGFSGKCLRMQKPQIKFASLVFGH
jgi:hypothetical protein